MIWTSLWREIKIKVFKAGLTIHIYVLSFTGTRVEDAKALMGASDLKIIACDNLDEAAKMVIYIAKQNLNMIDW